MSALRRTAAADCVGEDGESDTVHAIGPALTTSVSLAGPPKVVKPLPPDSAEEEIE